MAKNDEVIKIDNVSMKFNLNKERVDNIKEYFIKSIKGQISYNEFWALQDVSFTLNKGDRLGILGFNGAGKSTLLKVLAGVLKPTTGNVNIKGRIVPLLELGAGFDQQYTGRENVFLYGAVLGYSKSFLEERYDEIVEFSELGDFMDVPVKNYSSGMKARLGFSIATLVDPEILILDEVLSVGDARFRKKSLARIQGMMGKGVTVLFVSHNLRQIRAICNKAIILEHGKMVDFGDIGEVGDHYEQMLGEADEDDLSAAEIRARDRVAKQKEREERQKQKEIRQKEKEEKRAKNRKRREELKKRAEEATNQVQILQEELDVTKSELKSVKSELEKAKEELKVLKGESSSVESNTENINTENSDKQDN